MTAKSILKYSRFPSPFDMRVPFGLITAIGTLQDRAGGSAFIQFAWLGFCQEDNTTDTRVNDRTPPARFVI